ncbi:MAG: alpha/beta hydrolase [Synechococcales cyanobacterium RM1_1_8]|nr:alpha/beta hydrolase [Synechococcales cyanobacterium RM1_1_8]
MSRLLTGHSARTIATKLIGQWSLWRVLRLFLLAYGTLCVYGWFFSNQQMFFPQPASYGEADISLRLPVAEDRKIAVLSLPNPEAKLTILYSHGNAEDLGDIRPKLERIGESGYSVVAYDYAGYGLSDGEPGERRTYREIEAVYRYVVEELEVPPGQIVVYGRSIGGGPSLYLASREPVGGLIVESSFVSAFRVLTRVPLVPFDKFPNLARMKQVSVPVLIMHGEQDGVIPLWHGQKLYEAAPEPKQALWVEAAGHNDFIEVAGDRFDQALKAFAELVIEAS